MAAGNKYWIDSTPVAGQQFTYAFDSIGNRRTMSFGGDQNGTNLRSAVYSPNSVNEYASRTVPGYVQALGLANSNATVSLWGSDGSYSPTTRKGQYFRGELGVNNTNAVLWLTVTNLGVLKNGLNPDILTNSVGNVFVPPSSESFVYDWDGNLTQDGRWQYTWDAENRLVSMQGVAGIPTAAKLKLDFTYDAQGRRIQKTVSTNNGSSYVAQSTALFAYDGWNLVAQLSTPSSLLRSYAWGLDLSGSSQGAGGIGGLLAINDPSNGEQFPAYDGNGNLVGLIRGADGTLSANYEYGPFGEVLRATGSMAKVNPFRFSTKYQDDEHDILYYGYRYYNASSGRCISRDPAQERTSPNLYELAGNDPLSSIDVLGLMSSPGCRKCAVKSVRQQFVGIAFDYQGYNLYLVSKAVFKTSQDGPQFDSSCCSIKQWAKGKVYYDGWPVGHSRSGAPLDGEWHIDAPEWRDKTDDDPSNPGYQLGGVVIDSAHTDTGELISIKVLDQPGASPIQPGKTLSDSGSFKWAIYDTCANQASGGPVKLVTESSPVSYSVVTTPTWPNVKYGYTK